MIRAANFENTVKNFAKKKAAEIEKIVKEKFGLSNSFTVKLGLSYSPHRYRSRGGLKWVRTPGGSELTPFMNLALYPSSCGKFHEYASFAKDPEIGAIENCSWKKWVTVLIVHEISHVVQFSLMRPNQFARNGSSYQGLHNIPQRTTGHDALWKDIYRMLRNEIVNGVEFDSEESVVEPEAKVVKPAAKAKPKEVDSELKMMEPKPRPGEKTKKDNPPEKLLGKVKIVNGRYENKPVQGVFDLVREYKPKAGLNNEGTVTIFHNDRIFRIRVTLSDISYVFNK